jgi:hypothetical protein
VEGSPRQRGVVRASDLESAAEALRSDPARVRAARRLRIAQAGSPAVDRLVELAVRLLGAQAGQISLLDDIQSIAGVAGLPPGGTTRVTGLTDTPCTLAAAGT